MQAEKTIPERITPSYLASATIIEFRLKPQNFVVDVDILDDDDNIQTVTADMTDEWNNWAQVKRDEWNATFKKIVAEALNIPVQDVTGDLWT